MIMIFCSKSNYFTYFGVHASNAANRCAMSLDLPNSVVAFHNSGKVLVKFVSKIEIIDWQKTWQPTWKKFLGNRFLEIQISGSGDKDSWSWGRRRPKSYQLEANIVKADIILHLNVNDSATNKQMNEQLSNNRTCKPSKSFLLT